MDFDEDLEFSSPKNPSTGFLTNQSNYGFVIDDKRWPTVEHYVQAKKFEGTQFEEQIRNAKSIHQVRNLTKERYRAIEDPYTGNLVKEKVYGKDYKIREDWENIYPSYLEEALTEKFAQNKSLQKKLVQTGDVRLIDKNNHLTGPILEKLREKYLSSKQDTIKTKPVIFEPNDIELQLTDIEIDILVKFIRTLIEISKKVMESEGYNELYLGMVEDAIYTFFGSRKNPALEFFKESQKIRWTYIQNHMPHFKTLINATNEIFQKTFINIPSRGVNMNPDVKIKGPVAVAYIAYNVVLDYEDQEWELLRNRVQNILQNIKRLKIRYLKRKRNYREGAPPKIPLSNLTSEEKKYLKDNISSLKKDSVSKLTVNKVRKYLEKDNKDIFKRKNFKSYVNQVIDELTRKTPNTDKFVYHSKSEDRPPGKGKQEKLESYPSKYSELEKIKDWRKKLSSSYEKEFVLNRKRWLSVEHYYQAMKFKNSYPEFSNKFSLDSKSKFSKSSSLAKFVGEKKHIKGKEGEKDIRPRGITEDKDFHTRKVKGILYPDHIIRQSTLAKFTQIPDLKETLLTTGNATLFHKVSNKPLKEDKNLEWVRSIIKKHPNLVFKGKKSPQKKEKGPIEIQSKTPDYLVTKDETSGNFIVYGKPLADHAHKLIGMGGKYPRTRKGKQVMPDKTRLRFKFYMKQAVEDYLFTTYDDKTKLQVCVDKWIEDMKNSFIEASIHIADLQNSKEITKEILEIVVKDIYNFNLELQNIEPKYDVKLIVNKLGYSIDSESENYLEQVLNILERKERIGNYEEYLERIKRIGERPCPQYKNLTKVQSCILTSLNSISTKLSKLMNNQLDFAICNTAFLILLPPFGMKKGAKTYVSMVLEDYQQLGLKETEQKYDFSLKSYDICNELDFCSSEECLLIFLAASHYINNLIEKPTNSDIKKTMSRRVQLFLDKPEKKSIDITEEVPEKRTTRSDSKQKYTLKDISGPKKGITYYNLLKPLDLDNKYSEIIDYLNTLEDIKLLNILNELYSLNITLRKDRVLSLVSH